MHKVSKIQDPPESCELQKNYTNKSPYWSLTNSRCHCKKIILYGDLVPWICVPLVMSARVTETK
jgi:hypothetical protein